MRPPVTLLALLVAAACAEDRPPPPSQSFGRPPTAAAAPVTQFDGRYVGTIKLNPDRTRACPPGPAEEREITVTNGRATLLYRTQPRITFNGTVGADGSVRMADAIDRLIATSGQFLGSEFQGEHRNGLCTYAVTMRKV